MAAPVAVDAQESMSEQAALEVGPDLPRDEARDGGTRGPGAFEERLEVPAHDAVKERLLGLVAFVTNLGGFAGTRVEPNS